MEKGREKQKKKRRNECMSIGSAHLMSCPTMFIINFPAFRSFVRSFNCCSIRRGLNGCAIVRTASSPHSETTCGPTNKRMRAPVICVKSLQPVQHSLFAAFYCYRFVLVPGRKSSHQRYSEPRRFLNTFQWLAVGRAEVPSYRMHFRLKRIRHEIDFCGQTEVRSEAARDTPDAQHVESCGRGSINQVRMPEQREMKAFQ